ncbi:MAG: hypothetical protein WA919_26960 [Coleofasciculaceae cyanobacterium]
MASCNQYAVDDQTLQALVSHLTENRWREVFLLTVQMLDSADVLLRLMKQEVDSLLSDDENLQVFLTWLFFKSLSASLDDKINYYKLVAIRVFYFCLVFIHEFRLFSCDEPMDLADQFNVHIQGISFSKNGLSFDLELYSLLDFLGCSWFSPKDALATNIDNILEYFPLPHNPKTDIKKLKDNLPQLPDPNQEKDKFTKIWANISPIWTEQLRRIMIKYRKIGYDWQLSEEQLELLMQYYDANNFLLECLDLPDIYVSREVRQEIEDTLLLPIEEIKKRNN